MQIVCSYVHITWHIAERKEQEVGGGVSDKGTKGQGVPRDDLNKGPPPVLFESEFFFQNFKLKLSQH
jgi:hypothetical protein